MAEPLTIYVCPSCGTIAGQDHSDGCAGAMEGWDEVRVFREEDVRPLWDWIRRDLADNQYNRRARWECEAMMAAFPAPERWEAVPDLPTQPAATLTFADAFVVVADLPFIKMEGDNSSVHTVFRNLQVRHASYRPRAGFWSRPRLRPFADLRGTFATLNEVAEWIGRNRR